MRYDPSDVPASVRTFMTERHLASLSLVVPGPDVHVTPVGFTWDDDAGIARVITWAASKKVRLIDASGSVRAALSQVDGGRWLTLHGLATVTADPVVNADAVQRYESRYSPAKDRGADRRTIEIAVDAILGRVPD